MAGCVWKQLNFIGICCFYPCHASGIRIQILNRQRNAFCGYKLYGFKSALVYASWPHIAAAGCRAVLKNCFVSAFDRVKDNNITGCIRF